MRVLLTGGEGFLGKYVQEELRSKNIEYTVWSHTKHGSLCFGENLYIFPHWGQYTHIIHLAARVGGIGANQKSPYDFISENLLMGLNVIEMARAANLKVVMTSTVCAYPAFPKTIPFVEKEIWNGYPEETNAPYGIAKRTLGEVLSAAKKQYGLDFIVLNLANLYGKDDNDDLENSHVIPSIIRKVREAKKLGNSVLLWGNGNSTRDFLHAKDAATAIVKSLNCKADLEFGMNIGTGVETSVQDLAKLICKKMDYPYEKMIKWDNYRQNGQARRVLDCKLAKHHLDWQYSISLDEGLNELCGSLN